MMWLVDRPTLWPNACVCGNSVNGPFLDTGVHDRFDAKQGRIYLCNVHLLEALRVEKLVPLAELEQQVARLGAALGEVAQLEQQVRTATERSAALQAKLDEQESSIQETRSTNRILEQRVAEAQVDPAQAEHERAVATLQRGRRRSRAGKAS